MDFALTDEVALNAAWSRAAIVLPPHRPFVKMFGGDSLEFLHRISTNDLLSLQEGEVRSTILCNEKGRVVDLVEVLNEGGSLVLALSSPTVQETIQWCSKYVISEDVEISPLSSDITEAWFIGPQGKTMCEQADAILLETGLATKTKEWSHPTRQWRSEISGTAVWRIAWASTRHETRDDLNELLSRRLDVSVLSERAFEVWRICSGIPAWGRELSQPFTPVEMGLKPFISHTKGCYIGQEVIARIQAYRKSVRRLVGFSVTGARSPLEGHVLWVDGHEDGPVTSASPVLSRGRQCGIAIGSASPGSYRSAFVLKDGRNETPVTLHEFPIELMP